MRALARRAAVLAALTFLVFPLAGCETKQLTILIPDFDSKQVEGVCIWRRSEATGQFEREAQIALSEPFFTGGREQVEYWLLNAQGARATRIYADVLRDPRNPDAVTLQLYYWRWSAAGEFRATSYNEAGESPLSTTSTWL